MRRRTGVCIRYFRNAHALCQRNHFAPRGHSEWPLVSGAGYAKTRAWKKKSPPPPRRRRQAESHPAPRRSGKAALRAKPARDAGRALAAESPLHPVGELLEALRSEKIRFLIVGMTSAVLQGAPCATVDTDIWIDLPVRQYVRVLAIAKRLGASILSGSVTIIGSTLSTFSMDSLRLPRSGNAQSRSSGRALW